MATFSERHGYTSVRTEIQIDTVDENLRTDLWNVISVLYDGKNGAKSKDQPPMLSIWINVWHKPIDELPTYVTSMLEVIKRVVLGAEWTDVYDVVDQMVSCTQELHPRQKRAEIFNRMLEKNLSAWRFVDGILVQVDSTTDVEAIEGALRDSNPLSGVQYHLREALKQLADREQPNYSLSIKESISAVEATCKLITNQPRATLTTALKRLQDAGVVLHDNQIEGWKKLYWYSSDAKGIRHAALETPEVSQAEARYWLVSCSAFVSLLIHLWQQNLSAVEALDEQA